MIRALQAGAKAYLLKDSAEADLISAIVAVRDGKSFFSPAVSSPAGGLRSSDEAEGCGG